MLELSWILLSYFRRKSLYNLMQTRRIKKPRLARNPNTFLGHLQSLRPCFLCLLNFITSISLVIVPVSEVLSSNTCISMMIKRVKRPEQNIPSKVWKHIVADIVTTTGSEPNEQQQRAMKDNLRNYLDDLSTGTANGEGDAKPELQKEEVLRPLKETYTYASKVLLTKRHQLIGDQTTPVKKQKLSRKSQNIKPDPNIEDSDDEEPAEMNRKEARARTTQAIEKNFRINRCLYKSTRTPPCSNERKDENGTKQARSTPGFGCNHYREETEGDLEG